MWRGAASLLALLFAGSAADTNQCFTPNGTKANCGPAAQQCGPNFANAPAFHVMDASCAENDPNGPVYDHKHGMYHLFYQDHLAEVPGHGPVYGHAVSRDLAHWARLPVAIWNDQPYDNEAIYTGSATVVDGNIIQVYPGLCNSHDWASCGTGTNLAVAVPADPSDPLLTNWTKPDYNPIINGSQRDPSTAWKTPDGEWRLTTYDTVVYGSMDFKTWYKIGEQPGFPTGECPSFFELPRATPGSQPHPTAETPTHVHKCSHGGKDWMQVGSYTPNGPHLAGTWTATPGVSFAESIIDVGSYYASKDFYDPVKKRRINWGWAQVPPASTQSLPREVTWDAQLQQLVFSPLEEQATLRGDALAAMGKTHLHPGSLPVKLAKSDAAGQSETQVVFSLPQGACNLGVRLTTSSPTSALFNIDFIPNANTSSPTWEVNVGAETKTTAHVMQSYDLPGDDYNVTNVDYTDFATCEAACNGDAKCVAWTYVVRPPLHASCCLKSSVPSPVKWSKGSIVSGVKNPQPTETSAPLRLGAGDTTLTMSLYVDNTFTEAYWQGGRVAMTLPTPVASGAGLEIVSGCDATLESLDTWEVKSIWVDPEEVLRTPRLDGKV